MARAIGQHVHRQCDQRHLVRQGHVEGPGADQGQPMVSVVGTDRTGDPDHARRRARMVVGSGVQRLSVGRSGAHIPGAPRLLRQRFVQPHVRCQTIRQRRHEFE